MSWMDREPLRGGYPSMELLALNGADRMRAALRGHMPKPPIHYLFGLQPTSSGVAHSVFTMPASPWLQSAVGVFLAGTSALVADAPLGSAILGPLGPGKFVVTSDLTINYLRPSSPRSEQLIARARPIEVGRRLGLAEAVIEDSTGDLLAHATTRCFIQEVPFPEGGELPRVDEPVYESPDPYRREPVIGHVDPEGWARRPFLELVHSMIAGDIPGPPFGYLFGLTELTAEEGYFQTTASSTPWLTSPAGTIYGGFLAYWADSVLSGAISTTLPVNFVCAPLDLKVNFLRPVMPDGRPLVARAKVVHRGRSLALAECEITNADGKSVVRATSSATILEGPSWMRPVVDDAAGEVAT